MPVQQDLIDAIDAALTSAISASYTTASAANDIFEAYVWSLIVAAARAEGAAITFQSVNGAAVTQLIFRTSPGRIYSTHKQYTHAVLDFRGCQGVSPNCPNLEAHIGVFVTGKSGILHECDVAVLDRSEAVLCRSQSVHPRNSKLLSAVECKFYTGTLQLGLARAFLGLTEELSKSERFLVTNSSSPTAQKMVTYHKVEWEFRLDLRDPSIASNLQARFARMFRNYKAKHHIT